MPYCEPECAGKPHIKVEQLGPATAAPSTPSFAPRELSLRSTLTPLFNPVPVVDSAEVVLGFGAGLLGDRPLCRVRGTGRKRHDQLAGDIGEPVGGVVDGERSVLRIARCATSGSDNRRPLEVTLLKVGVRLLEGPVALALGTIAVHAHATPSVATITVPRARRTLLHDPFMLTLPVQIRALALVGGIEHPEAGDAPRSSSLCQARFSEPPETGTGIAPKPSRPPGCTLFSEKSEAEGILDMYLSDAAAADPTPLPQGA